MWINVKNMRINTDNITSIGILSTRETGKVIMSFAQNSGVEDILFTLDEAQAETVMAWLDRFLNIADIAQMETDLEEPPTYIPF